MSEQTWTDKMSVTREDRIKGVLLGQAAGDALGAGYETGRHPEGKAEMIGGGFGFAPGEWTDDTQQATCVAAARADVMGTAANLITWYKSMPKDVGGTTHAVLRGVNFPGELVARAREIADMEAQWDLPAGWDPGMANGSLMRTGPVALSLIGTRLSLAERARRVSDLTHAEAFTGDACVLWSLAIEESLSQEWQGWAHSAPEFRVLHGLDFIPVRRRNFWLNAIQEAARTEHGDQFRANNGGAVGAFKAALWAVCSADSLEDGLQRAVGIGHDTDTVAAIAGSFLGAIFGASAVPAAWRGILHGWSPEGTLDASQLEQLALYASGDYPVAVGEV